MTWVLGIIDVEDLWANSGLNEHYVEITSIKRIT